MKKKIISIVSLIIIAIASISLVVIIKTGGKSKEEEIDFNAQFNGKINQWSTTLGYVDRNIPTTTSNEGCNARYPTYGTKWSDITDEEKDNLLKENSLIMASATTYDSMDEQGNLYLNGEATGGKLYKHTASVGMYYGDVSDSEKAVVERITISSNEQRNFVTGLYAPAGEVVKIEISQTDLDTIGGELLVCVGQVSHRNNVNNIWKDAGAGFSRMPVVANKISVKSTTAYVGNMLGGPIFIYPKNFGNTFTVTISGSVKYAHYIHGKTTKQEVEKMKNYSAPYYDYEIWDLGVRFSGSASYGNYDYENLVKVGGLWERIIRTSRQVPCSANVTIGVGYVFDCFVAAGSACAFQGGHSWINAPCNWMEGALNYNSMVTNGFWGQIHEYNHLYQSYGMESSKTNEVTNNATSLLSYTLYTKISQKRSLNDSTLTGWERYTDASRSLRETISNADNNQTQNALNAYADIIHTFGVDVFTKATRLQNGFGVDNWYEALSLATNYNFTYYFEQLLHQTISDDKKALYDTADRIIFVPVATIFQTCRDFYENDAQIFNETMQPYQIERGESCEINFNERLILPSDFSFRIKSVSNAESGKIEKISENIYKYTPSTENNSGKINVVVELISETYSTKDVTLTLCFEQYDKNQVQATKYTYGGDVSYSSVAQALENNFEGYTNVEKYKSSSTFMNGLANKQIGIVEGKIYIEKSGNYSFCLRSGRGNNTLYLSVNDKNNLKEVLSLNTDHGGFAIEGEHTVKMYLNKGDYLYFKEITLSRHYADAFTELGMACLDDDSPSMQTIPTKYLCTNDMLMPSENFTSNEKYKREYVSSNTITNSHSSTHKLVSANMSSWSNGEGVENIFDADSSKFFHNNRNNFVSESNPFILEADMCNEQTFNGIKIVSRTSGQYNLPSTFTLYGSLNGNDWDVLGEFVDLSLVGNSVSASFADAKFRYYKLYVTDTKSATSGNKYVTIEHIEFLYNFNGTEKSPDALRYYKTGKKNFEKIETVSSFGYLIKGNGSIKYDFYGSGIILFVRQDNNCKIRVTMDGNSREITLQANPEKQIAFSSINMAKEYHSIKIEVLKGSICVDYFVQKV